MQTSESYLEKASLCHLRALPSEIAKIITKNEKEVRKQSLCEVCLFKMIANTDDCFASKNDLMFAQMNASHNHRYKFVC